MPRENTTEESAMTQPNRGADLDDLVAQELAYELQTHAERHARSAVDAAFTQLADHLEHVALRFRRFANQADISPTERGEWARHEVRALQGHLTLAPMSHAIQEWERADQEVERISAALEALLDAANAS
jgi:hypothetical protein